MIAAPRTLNQPSGISIRCRNCGAVATFPSRNRASSAPCPDCGEPLSAKGPEAGFHWGVLIPAGLVLIAIGLCFVWNSYQRASALTMRGVVTEATPTEVLETNKGGGVRKYIHYRFRVPPSSTWYTHDALFGLHQFWIHVDDAQMAELMRTNVLPVTYDPQDPSNNAPVGYANVEVYSEPLLFACVGVMLICKSVLWRLRRRALARTNFH